MGLFEDRMASRAADVDFRAGAVEAKAELKLLVSVPSNIMSMGPTGNSIATASVQLEVVLLATPAPSWNQVVPFGLLQLT
jgi:hypothetical protein